MTHKKQTFETYCPLFPGFYGTFFEYDNEEMDIEWYNEEHKTDLSYDDFEWNYKEYSDRIARAFVNRLESELKYFLPIKIEFEEIRSPREYNFYNDSINVKITLNLGKLIKLIKEREDKARQYFKDKYTSCSGFISFHSNQFENWIDPAYIMKEPAHRIGGLLDCLCAIEFENEDIYDWTSGECYIDFWPTNENETVTN